MYCKASTAVEVRSKLGFKQHDLIMTKEQSVLTTIMKIYASEKILLQHSVLSYRTDLHFPEHKLAINVDEKRQKDRDEYEEVERKNAIKEHLDCKFIRINPDEKDFDMNIKTGKTYNNINKSSKKSLTDKISK